VSALAPILGGTAARLGILQLAGGLSGVAAMTALIASGVVPLGPPEPRALVLLACPGSGSVVAVAHPGEQMLVTGRSYDGGWLRVYVPKPDQHEGWVPATSVDLLADGSHLPPAGCGQVLAATASPRVAESSTLTSTAVPATVGPTVPPTATPTAAASASPTTKPTDRPRTPPPTVAPTSGSTAAPTQAPTPTPNVGPKFTAQPTSSASSLGAQVLETSDCTGLTTTVTISTAVADPDGVASIQLWVRKPGAATFSQFSHGFANHGATWTAFIKTYFDHINTVGTLEYYAVAVDSKGATTTSVKRAIETIRCDSPASISGGIDLPAGSGYDYRAQCSLPWSFTVADPDGPLSKVRVTYSYSGPLNGSGALNLAYTLFIKTWSGDTGYLLAQPGLYTVSWQVTSTDGYGGTTAIGGTNTVGTDCGLK
jgi:hypothetical protein